MNRRREFLIALGAVPWTAQAQKGRPRTLGALDPFPNSSITEGELRNWLRHSGYSDIELQRVVVLGSNGRDDLLPRLATQLVALRPAVILTWGDAAVQAAQAATTDIPIVVMTDNLVGAGHVSSLNRPGGNVTGISVMSTELDAKRLELLAPILPPRSTVMLLADAVTSPLSRPALHRTAAMLGLQLIEVTVRTLEEMQRALADARKSGIVGVNVLASPLLFAQSEHLIGWANGQRLPAIFEWGFLADKGALVAYGPLIEPLYRRLFKQVVGLMRGGHVNDFPVEQPTSFEFVINLRTSRAVGVEIPQQLMLRADRVIG